jgi:hypothetical protein
LFFFGVTVTNNKKDALQEIMIQAQTKECTVLQAQVVDVLLKTYPV